MTILKYKSTVNVPAVCIIVSAVHNAATLLCIEAIWVTSGNDSKHKDGSKHYVDAALDFRTKHLSLQQKTQLVRDVKKRLGEGYDVILESVGKVNEHLHIEYDPKLRRRQGTWTT